ncbi:MAG: hypothetical protein P0Y49_16830 [Candidatus Pedobacter colombiensis]|uniref:Bacteriocin n=1 Tax=Candidatus Pedobacter colombiensis TaxID=3121371 RepID=A0AAJ5W5G8_9SPHI|nr:hypothetical protein [Pedobacter sp.]WEK18456.1 MAG: hypothetical protein P0Y49_16830 [Pedobacter sp.]
MKKLNLNNLGVQELNSVEMTKVEGGGLLSGLGILNGLGLGNLTGALAPVTSAVNCVLNDTFAFVNKQLKTVLGAFGGL